MTFVPIISDAHLATMSESERQTLKERVEFELTHARQRVADLEQILERIANPPSGSAN